MKAGKYRYFVGGLVTRGIITAMRKLGQRTINIQRKEMADSIKQHRKLGYKTSYKTKDMNPTTIALHRMNAKTKVREGIKKYLTDKTDISKINASIGKSKNKGLDLLLKSLEEANKFRKKIN